MILGNVTNLCVMIDDGLVVDALLETAEVAAAILKGQRGMNKAFISVVTWLPALKFYLHRLIL